MSGTQTAATAKAAPPAISASPALRLQRTCACGGSTELTGECEECQKEKLLGQPLQRKLAINEPGDAYEQEADRIADQVLAAPAHTAPRVGTLRIQRYSHQAATNGLTAPPSVEHVLASPGMPLDGPLLQDMEWRFGHKFSQVRIHADAKAGQSARDVSAHAYTVGHDLVFAAGRYAPRTTEGRRLIAHELAHVTQQSVSGQNVSPPPVLQRQPYTPAQEPEIGAEEREPQTLEQRLARAKSAYYDQLWLRFRQATMMCSPERCPELWEHEGDLQRERELRLSEASVILNVTTGDVAAADEDLREAEAGPSWVSVEDAAADGLATDEDLDRLARDAADMDVERLFASLGYSANVILLGTAVSGQLGTMLDMLLPKMPRPLIPSLMLGGALKLSEPELGTDVVRFGTRGPQATKLTVPGQPEPELGSDVVQVGIPRELPEPEQALNLPVPEFGAVGWRGPPLEPEATIESQPELGTGAERKAGIEPVGMPKWSENENDLPTQVPIRSLQRMPSPLPIDLQQRGSLYVLAQIVHDSESTDDWVGLGTAYAHTVETNQRIDAEMEAVRQMNRQGNLTARERSDKLLELSQDAPLKYEGEYIGPHAGVGRRAVAIAEFKFPNGETAFYASANDANLSPDQVNLLRNAGIPEENILRGSAVKEFKNQHGEQIIIRYLKENYGADADKKITRWGISWKRNLAPEACETCQALGVDQSLVETEEEALLYLGLHGLTSEDIWPELSEDILQRPQ